MELAQLVNKICDAWQLTGYQRCQVLGLPPCSDFGSINMVLLAKTDVLTRALDIAVIYEILHVSNLQRPDLADRWPTTPSPELAGKTPVDLMSSLEGMATIRRWLEDQE